ncbi:hypothetical protein HD806DRAFT_517258 [Xylariaceae sp. AK1471]|nr:hypothetical protein HD806DRAFT_517258 [Xylariaceae sp. AK1471]
MQHAHRTVSSGSLGGGYTAFIWVQSLPTDAKDKLALFVEIDKIYDYRDWNAKNQPQPSLILQSVPAKRAPINPRALYRLERGSSSLNISLNDTSVDEPASHKEFRHAKERRSRLRREAGTTMP